jgi:beta-phosphoglucomutase-like phosphatase (HAD superfamily)
VRKKADLYPNGANSERFTGVKELVLESLSGRSKALVTGSSKQGLDTILKNNFMLNAFSVTLNGDEFEGKGKPDPASCLEVVLSSSPLTAYDFRELLMKRKIHSKIWKQRDVH